jgi:hypothetical protein
MSIWARWDGEAFWPMRDTGEAFAKGTVYQLEEVKPRSHQSHKQYFAVINNAFASLREDQDHMWKDAQDLRAWALIEAGYGNMIEETFPSQAEAIRSARFVQRAAAAKGVYCRVELQDRKVIYWTARSQARGAMSAAEFQQSKDAVFRVLSQLIGVPVEELSKETEEAA